MAKIGVDVTKEQLEHAVEFCDNTNPDGTGENSVAIGDAYTQATGNEAVSIGSFSSAAGNKSVAMGYKSKTKGPNNIAIGSNSATETNGMQDVDNSIAIGCAAKAYKNEGIAIGHITQAREDCIAIGHTAIAAADNTIQIGTGRNETANTVQIKNTQILNENGKIPASSIEGGGGGTSDYEELENLPSINGNTIIGNKSSNDLGIKETLKVTYTKTNDVWSCDTSFSDILSAATSGRFVVADAVNYRGNQHTIFWLVAVNSTAIAFSVASVEFTGAMIHLSDGTIQLVEFEFDSLFLKSYVTQTTGNSDYYVMSQKAVTDALASKLDTNQGSANVGKVMTVGNDGIVTPQVAQGTTYTAGQNISISAQNVISAGIEVIEI